MNFYNSGELFELYRDAVRNNETLLPIVWSGVQLADALLELIGPHAWSKDNNTIYAYAISKAIHDLELYKVIVQGVNLDASKMLKFLTRMAAVELLLESLK